MGAVFGGPQLRLLCLHGFSTSSKIMDVKQMNLEGLDPSWDDYLGDVISCRFVDGTFEVNPRDIPDELKGIFGPRSSEDHFYEWWRGHQLSKFDRVYPHEGIDDSIQRLSKIWKEEGPFDGLVGFSQGAALASIIVMGVSKGYPQFEAFADGNLKVFLSFSGWAVKGGPYACLFDSSKPEPFVMAPPAMYFSAGGKKDAGREPSEELIAKFKDQLSDNKTTPVKEIVVEWHKGAHVIPRPTAQLRAFLASLQAPGRLECL